MKYLKHFESTETISEADKIQAIIDMYDYLCDNRIGNDFIGECTGLFMGVCRLERTKKRLFNPDVESIIQGLDNTRYSDRKRELINKLYPFAKEIHSKQTIEYVEKLILPFVESSTVIDGKIYERDWFWRAFDSKQAFIFEFRMDPEVYEIDEKDVIGKGHPGRTYWNDKDKIPAMERSLKVFYQYRKIIKRELSRIPFKSNKLRYELMDSSHFNDLYKLRLLILPI